MMYDDLWICLRVFVHDGVSVMLIRLSYLDRVLQGEKPVVSGVLHRTPHAPPQQSHTHTHIQFFSLCLCFLIFSLSLCAELMNVPRAF